MSIRRKQPKTMFLATGAIIAFAAVIAVGVTRPWNKPGTSSAQEAPFTEPGGIRVDIFRPISMASRTYGYVKIGCSSEAIPALTHKDFDSFNGYLFPTQSASLILNNTLAVYSERVTTSGRQMGEILQTDTAPVCNEKNPFMTIMVKPKNEGEFMPVVRQVNYSPSAPNEIRIELVYPLVFEHFVTSDGKLFHPSGNAESNAIVQQKINQDKEKLISAWRPELNRFFIRFNEKVNTGTFSGGLSLAPIEGEYKDTRIFLIGFQPIDLPPIEIDYTKGQTVVRFQAGATMPEKISAGKTTAVPGLLLTTVTDFDPKLITNPVQYIGQWGTLPISGTYIGGGCEYRDYQFTKQLGQNGCGATVGCPAGNVAFARRKVCWSACPADRNFDGLCDIYDSRTGNVDRTINARITSSTIEAIKCIPWQNYTSEEYVLYSKPEVRIQDQLWSFARSQVGDPSCENLCGNGKVDSSEECDPKAAKPKDEKRECTNECKWGGVVAIATIPESPKLANALHVTVTGVKKEEAMVSGSDMFDRYCSVFEPPKDEKNPTKNKEKAYCLVGSWKELKNDAGALQSLDSTLPLSFENKGDGEYWYGLERSKLLNANLSGTLYVYGKDLKFVTKKEIQFKK